MVYNFQTKPKGTMFLGLLGNAVPVISGYIHHRYRGDIPTDGSLQA